MEPKKRSTSETTSEAVGTRITPREKKALDKLLQQRGESFAGWLRATIAREIAAAGIEVEPTAKT